MKTRLFFRYAAVIMFCVAFATNIFGVEILNFLPDWLSGFLVGGGSTGFITADAFATAAETTEGGPAKVSDDFAHNKSTVSRILTKIMPSAFPMDNILRELDTAETKSTKYEYFKVRTRGIQAQVAQTSTAAPVATITLDSAHIFSVDGNVLVPSFNATSMDSAAEAVPSGGISYSPLVLHICAISRAQNQITVIALNASSVPALPSGTILKRMGTAKYELAAMSEDPISKPVSDYNYCQIHMTTIGEGLYQALQEKEVNYGLAEFKEQALYDFRMTNEIDTIFGVRNQFTDPDGKEKYTSDGLLRKITKTLDKGDAANVTEDVLLGWSADVFQGNNGSDKRILFYGTEFGKAIANCRTIYKSLEANKTEVKFGITFNVIETNFGTFLMKFHSLLNSYGYGSMGIVIDPANVYRAIQKPLEATTLELDKSGKSRSKDVRIDESHTLAVTNPDTHALLFA